MKPIGKGMAIALGLTILAAALSFLLLAELDSIALHEVSGSWPGLSRLPPARRPRHATPPALR